jgi:hypothetical protein
MDSIMGSQNFQNERSQNIMGLAYGSIISVGFVFLAL